MDASNIIVIGKLGAKLEKTRELGATAVIELSEKLDATDFAAAAYADVMLDYLREGIAEVAMLGIVAKRKSPSQRLTWIEIGALAGDENQVSAAMLRKAHVALMGCGPGSWTFAELDAQLPAVLRIIVDKKMEAEYVVGRLTDVESWWNETGGPRQLVKP